ncbi:MAG TPA: helix-turn-helix transcriptional regulator [Thermoanaerobaculia bacterium]|nr:helix-turn-helix transcriptional regulator [Thermoanaerobaculia bacterium]
MPREKLSPEALALIYLRSQRGWSKKELASRLGLSDVRQLYRYERGEAALRREDLESIAARLGYSPEAVEALLFIHSLTGYEPRQAASPFPLTPEDRRRINRAVIFTGWTVAETVGDLLTHRRRKAKEAEARREAEELWTRLKTATRQERRDLVTFLPEFQSWALAVRVCEASVRAAADKPEAALELADLALRIAEQVLGEEGWRCRVKGYVWAHVANARRVANDFAGADEAFARAWDLWRAGAAVDPDLLPEWRMFDLEASLRREQHRFSEALALLDQAQAGSRGEPVSTARILLKKEHVFEQMGDVQSALAVLAEAGPFVEASGDLHLLFALRFKEANNLCHLERYAEATGILPQVRELAVRLGNGLDLIRVVWLAAKVAAGQGRKEEATVGLEQVRRDFTVRQLPYDAARSSLDLAVLWIEAGRTAEVRELALAMTWIFKAQGIHREALAALSLFYDAAQQETATVELARQVIAEVERVRRSASQRTTGEAKH